ncbi:RNA polymerase sigma factor, partial [Streptomyces sp. NPDC056600]|uniref:RNA polymerase sigma factor n=1 Tax=Streptomyces sp. NPDC056600 TaxID=3345874 RepID=UPI003682EEB2
MTTTFTRDAGLRPSGSPPRARPSVDEDEAELVRGLRTADQDAFAAVYRRWGPLVHTMATRSLGDSHEAEDVTQQVFLGAWRGRDGYHPERGSLGGWLVGITRRKIVDALAARTRRPAPLDTVGQGDEDVGGGPPPG